MKRLKSNVHHSHLIVSLKGPKGGMIGYFKAFTAEGTVVLSQNQKQPIPCSLTNRPNEAYGMRYKPDAQALVGILKLVYGVDAEYHSFAFKRKAHKCFPPEPGDIHGGLPVRKG